ncbi:hypothetical protein A2454_01675 [Candidatus Peribacteria bacterium RIFOXYC2_FULL_55_14]|nr:MAG: hypothetical protein UY87_C0025G0020 [Candidatus Peribacteria bacterium GW2011_GWC2_54_8]KKW44376.1 MAG: hypothetical protein UY90_C0012G0019 [Candidatus Peregrinibacteria bacterium GW2011_GWA2_54_9]OGJ72383.1 MAG: hypothetical protein A2198_06300 [Candidatus Peribacteria bacterium RIFOXYA1_FULL_56_14]OGJ73432.1 MAG: hypothetical protein A2217_01855 [Candidatus Peribacteria bacterium RIFOXYA2_FULL_55_28]OGJ74614.1 MAG: hypothetical protein A2384_03145 [Candidatus Peribacteria bacterium 
MDYLSLLLHIDESLQVAVENYGPLLYAILFLIILCETGLVVTPFLPGDSLLFATGAIAALGDLDIIFLWLLLCTAAIVGDSINYAAGSWFGERIFNGKIPFLKPAYLERTHSFFARYGAKTIVLARFVPIVRTIAPFVAGAGTMHYRTFLTFNVAGSLLWVTLFLLGGYYFGQIELVKNNFEAVIFIIIALSLVPPFVEWWREKRKAKKALSP